MRIRATSVALLAVALAPAGCGSSSSTSTSAAATRATASAASTHAATTRATTPATQAFASAPNCQQLAGVGAKLAQAMGAASSGGKFNLQAAVAAYQGLVNAAPSEIRPDLQLMARAFSSFATALSKAGYAPGKVPTAAQLAGLQSAAQALNQPQLRSAEQKLSAWARQNCRA